MTSQKYYGRFVEVVTNVTVGFKKIPNN